MEQPFPGGTRILVVDDEAPILHLLDKYLTRQGAAVTTARDVPEAESHLGAQRFDVVLTDIDMPGRSGISLLLDARVRWPALPVVLMTGVPRETMDLQALKIRLDAVIFKPFNLDDLRRLLLRAIEEGTGVAAEAGAPLAAHEPGGGLAAEPAVHAGGDCYRVLFEDNPQPMFVVDAETRQFLAANDAALEHYGYTRDELFGMTILDIRPAEDGLAVVAELGREHGGIRHRGVWRHRRKDGALIDVDIVSHETTFQGRSASLVLAVDVTERRRAEEALRESEERYRTLFDNVPLGLYRTSPEGHILDANPALAELLGYPDRESLLEATATSHFVHPEERGQELDLLELEGVVRTYETELRRRDGGTIWVRDSARAVRGKSGRVLYYEGALQDVTERKHREEALAQRAAELRALTMLDELTGIYNRRGFVTLAKQYLKAADRKRREMILLYADLDRMKEINDELGHRVGDDALMETAELLREVFRESDLIARLGGDEFVVLAAEAETAASRALLGRLDRHLRLHNKRRGRVFSLSLSLGIAPYDPETPCTIEELLARADQQMYEQKRLKNVL